MNKIPIVLQKEIKDCGVCSLQSVIRYYGGYVSLEKIREDTYTSLEGTTVYHLKKAAEKYGFDVLAKKDLDYNFENHMLPVIIHVQYGNGLCHFMVVYMNRNDKLVIMDPSRGKVVMLKKELKKIFTGVVIELFPKSKIVLRPKERNIYQLFLSIIGNNKKLIYKILLINITLILLTIGVGFYFKVLYQFTSGVNMHILTYVIYIFLIMMIFKIIYSFVRDYYLNIVNKNIDVKLFSEFIQHLFKIPLNTISTRTTGEIMSRVNELWEIKELFSQLFISGFLDLFLSFGSLIVLLLINTQLSIVLVVYIIIYIFVTLIVSPYFYKRINENIDYQTNFNSVLTESIDMINSVKNLGKTKEVAGRIEEKLCLTLYDSYSFNQSYNYYNLLKSLIDELVIFIVSTWGFMLLLNNDISLISLFVFNSIMVYFIDPIKNILMMIPKFHFLRASFNKICDYIDLIEEPEEEIETFDNGNIELKNIDYSYDGYNQVLRDFNISFLQGEKVMVNGKSGSGKSTFCKLINRMIEPQGGSIMINNKNIMDYNLQTIRKNVTYVGQKEKLFTDTIRNNINFYNKDSQLFYEVSELCFINKIVDKKPFRYESGISNDANNLSGGEKQRIVLARALLNSGDILILDEALSEVDFDLEERIINNIINYYPHKTIIYVTHKDHTSLFERVINFGNI